LGFRGVLGLVHGWWVWWQIVDKKIASMVCRFYGCLGRSS
jgi:hypothetical protein